MTQSFQTYEEAEAFARTKLFAYIAQDYMLPGWWIVVWAS